MHAVMSMKSGQGETMLVTGETVHNSRAF